MKKMKSREKLRKNNIYAFKERHTNLKKIFTL